ncbi:unnamed protein product [Lactuca virosa]|uniref:Uncharacterized protein n=1 Tax=Lactuca virosa TaxID=75947 RepID=A0AAU9NXZ9_9ASTR|nr:unnamed protein product [Lactuca virosa]
MKSFQEGFQYKLIVIQEQGDEKLLSLEQVLRGNFGGDLQYPEVSLVEALLAPATVGAVPKCEASPVSRRRSVVVDSALGEDVSGDTIGRRLRRKRNIEPFLATSHVVIEIVDGDELSAAEAVCSHRRGKTIIAGGRSTSPSASNNVPSKAACVVAGVERGKQATLVLSSGSGSDPSEPGAVAQSTDAMHAAIRAFAETDFASYLRLAKLGLADLHELCYEEEDAVPYDDVEGSV